MARMTMDSRAAATEAASPITQLEFHSAMTDFKTMFPEIDDDVIECVLRANNGAVDATIDQLLVLSKELDAEKNRSPSATATPGPATGAIPRPRNNQLVAIDDEETNPPQYSQTTPPPAYHQAVPSTSEASAAGGVRLKNINVLRSGGIPPPFTPTTQQILNQKVSNNSLRARHKWAPPLLGPLPDSFLRYPSASAGRHPDVGVLSPAMLHQKMEENERKRMTTGEDDPELAQFLEDERFAILLQNEEFVRELRRNQEFMSQLQLDASARGVNPPSSAAGASSSGGQFSDAAFKEMLKNMSKKSRKKFAQVARMFTGRKKKSFQQLLSEQSTASGLSSSSPNRQSKDFLLAREDEYGVLENDSSDSDDRHSPYWERPAILPQHPDHPDSPSKKGGPSNKPFRT